MEHQTEKKMGHDIDFNVLYVKVNKGFGQGMQGDIVSCSDV